MSSKVKMKDIAEKLNISIVSVSKALSGKDGVSDEMRDKIFEVAQSLGYDVDKVKKNKLSGNICVIVADRFMDDNAFYQKLYRQIVINCTENGYSSVLEIVSLTDETNLKMPKAIDNNIDGIVFLGDISKKYIDKIRNYKIPFVLVDFHIDDYETDCFISDNIYGAMKLTELMIKKGRKKIAFVGDVLSTTSILDRYLGYVRVLLMNGIMPKEEYLIKDRNNDGEFIDIQLPKNMPDSFVCNCDEVAYNLIRKLQNEGYRIPEDISVSGYDDYLFSSLSSPQITTYRVNIEDMAKNSIKKLIERINGSTIAYSQNVVNGKIIEKESI